MGNREGQQLGMYHLCRLLSEDQWTKLYLGEHVEHKMRVVIKCAKYEGPKVDVQPSYVARSASDDSMVRTWVPIPDATILPAFDHAASVYTLSWSPDGKRLAAGDAANTIHLWKFSRDSLSQPREWLYHGHFAPVRAVDWSPDGTRIASGGEDRTVQVWSDGL